MIEKRAVIKSINGAKEKVVYFGAKYIANYIFTDIIFIKKQDNFNLNKDFIRMRVYTKNNWPTKKVVLVRKKTEFNKLGKNSNILLRKEFNTKKEAFKWIKDNIPEFKKGFEYLREGWEYKFNSTRIFIEDIKRFKPSIEIESDKEKDMEYVFEKVGVLKYLKDSIPELMRKKLKVIK